MRRRIVAGALVVGSAFLALPAAPAHADCNVVLLIVTGNCANECTIVRDTYRTADQTAFDALPDLQFICLT